MNVESRYQVLPRNGGDGNGEAREEIRDMISETKCLASKRNVPHTDKST